MCYTMHIPVGKHSEEFAQLLHLYTVPCMVSTIDLIICDVGINSLHTG